MTKNIILLIALVLVLSSCDKFGSSKITQLIDFTPVILADKESSDINITLDPASVNTSCHSFMNAVNQQPANIKFNQTINKFKKIKLSNNYSDKAPIIAENKIFILDNKSNVSAFDLANHKKLWSVSLLNSKSKQQLPGGNMVYAESKLAISNGSRNLFIISAEDGREIFQKTVNDIIKTQPVIHDNMVFVLTISNVIYAIDMLTGNVVWQHEALPETISSGKFVAPIIYKNNIIVSYSSGGVYMINIKTGEQEWGLNLAAENLELLDFAAQNVEVQPIIVHDSLYIASNSGYLHKISLDSGEIIWRKAVQDVKAMSYCGNMLFVVNNAKQVAAFKMLDGKVKWVNSLRNMDKSTAKTVTFSNLIMINNQLHIAASDGQLYIIDALTGNVARTITVSNDNFAINIVKDYYMLFNTDGNLSVSLK